MNANSNEILAEIDGYTDLHWEDGILFGMFDGEDNVVPNYYIDRKALSELLERLTSEELRRVTGHVLMAVGKSNAEGIENFAAVLTASNKQIADSVIRAFHPEY